jgi:hypothetical protein
MRQLRLVIILCCAIVLRNGEIYCQALTGTIRGVIKDEASESPIPYATVKLVGTTLGAATNLQGEFVCAEIPIGRYDIQAFTVGYEATIIKEIVVLSGKETLLTIFIREKITTLDEVIIKPTISKDEPVNSMAPVSARMLSVEEAQRYAGGFDDPARLAASFAGVGSNVGNNAIVVRGNAPKFLQWKMEGVEIPNPNHFADLDAFGGGGISALSSQMLSNSDFLTGAFPAEYSNALSGVFDLNIRNGNNQKRQHTFQVGTIGLEASAEGPFKSGGNSSYLFNYRYSALALITPLLPEGSEAIKYQDLSFKLNFPTKRAGVFSLWGIGLMDESGPDAEKDSTLWEYEEDKEGYTNAQDMGAFGFSHKYYVGRNVFLSTTLASAFRGTDLLTEKLDDEGELRFLNRVKNRDLNFIFSTTINSKLSAQHTNKSGILVTGLNYDLSLQESENLDGVVSNLVDEKGSSVLFSAYSASSLRMSGSVTLNIGLNGQLFSLNSRYTVEPRVGLKWNIDKDQYIAAGYGLHSRLERLNYYFVRGSSENGELPNKNLDFTKAHHFVLSYGRNLGENTILKIEPYYQQLFNVPVIYDSSFSMINLQNDWFTNSALENTGAGRNYGIDITLERFLSDGYFFLLTSSVFNSRYRGGDGIWRNTRFNRSYLFNLLGGKEWVVGKDSNKIFGLSIRLAYQGGDRYSPIDQTASRIAREPVHDESRAFGSELSPSVLVHFTARYVINKAKSTREIALKFLNVGMYEEFFGFRYNLVHERVEEYRQPLIIPNVSYTITF